MKFRYSLSIIFTITTLLSCTQNKSSQSVNNKKSENGNPKNVNLISIKRYSKRQNLNTVTEKNIESLINSDSAKFISFGIADQDFRKFKEKYGVDLKIEGCVLTSTLSKKAKENNTFLANYLTEKYGENWKKDLPFVPFGLMTI